MSGEPRQIGILMGGGAPGRREAHVATGWDGPWVTVRRVKPDGSMDWATWHATRFGARRAARRYERTGKVVGIRP